MAPEPRTLVKLFIVVLVAGAIFPVFLTLGGPTGSAVINATTSSYTVVDSSVDDIPTHVTVRATREYAVALDGNDVVESTAPTNLTDGDWMLCAAAELDESTDQNLTYDVFAYKNATVLLQFDAGQWSAYYDNGTHDAKAEIAAPSPTDGLTPVCAGFDNSSQTLVVTRATSVSNPVALTSSPDARNISENWTGRIDEVRGFGTFSNSTMTSYGSDPVQPLPGTDRLARFMFDDGSGSTSTVYFTSADAQLVGATWTTGLDDPGMTRGIDYRLEPDPFRLKIASGGYLVGAPVEFVTWSETSGATRAIIELLPLLAALLILVWLASPLMDSN